MLSSIRLHQYGPVPSAEVPLWASEADVCVVPIRPVCLSYAYCLPNKLFEGIQARLPIVASNLVEMQRTLDEYQCGLTYESGSIADLREKLLRVLESPELAAQLRRKAAQAALELNWENERKRLLQVVATMQSSVPASPSSASAIQS